MKHLAVSMVLYKSDWSLLVETLIYLCRALDCARWTTAGLRVSLHILDNEGRRAHNLLRARALLQRYAGGAVDELHLQVSRANLGYGGGHNQALRGSGADYCLILNPDVRLDELALVRALEALQSNQRAAVIAPRGDGPRGENLYLCKRFPPIIDLLVRGFGPRGVRRLFRPRLARYEMHELASTPEPVGVPMVSGCCMLLRGSALRALDGFDERYFLYFEDFDLSLRLGTRGSKLYLPDMRIVHYGGGAARKGLWHVLLFAASALRFYRQWGWRWL